MKIKITWTFFLIACCWFACSESQSGSNNQAGSNNEIAEGEKIFKKYCILCHGVDGKLGLNGAKDITVSQLTFEERVVLITKGKNTMTPFEGILTPGQIRAAATYSMSLKP
jgi:mono/diheme cytochrome c family protein